MKFHLSTHSGRVVTGVGPGWIRVEGTEYRENLILTPEEVIPGWAPGGFDALAREDFAALLEKEPELVLLGTGARVRFPHPKLTADLARAHVGIDAMDTAAACRTFNILAAEGRRVVAALLIDG